MPDAITDALPNSVKVRGGAYLVEEILIEGDGQISYRAYDVPARCPVILSEFFPRGARRKNLEVLAPSGWSAQGFNIAKMKWLQRHPDALASFEENGTAYITMGVDTPHALVQAEFPAPANPIKFSPSVHAPELPSTPIAAPAPPPAPVRPLSFADLWPDALRGAIQGGLLCGMLGVIFGILAAALGQNNLFSGAMLGLWAFPVGAICGALLGVLRALPSSAPALASASPLSPQEQIATTLAGAGKGALLGLPLGFALMLGRSLIEGVSLAYFASGLFLFGLLGAMAGAVVGFIRIMPRDRSRRS